MTRGRGAPAGPSPWADPERWVDEPYDDWDDWYRTAIRDVVRRTAEALHEKTLAEFSTPEALDELLAQLRELEVAVRAEITAAVRAARAAGLRWEDVGRPLAMSKQAAHQKFRHLG